MADKVFDPRTFHHEAIAVLELEKGETVENFRELLQNYSYTKDREDHTLWRYGETRSGLMFHNDNTLCIIVGTDEENVDNANFVLSGAGWDEVTLHTVDLAAESKVLECCKTLMVQGIERYWPPDGENDTAAALQQQGDSGAFDIGDSDGFGDESNSAPATHKSEHQEPQPTAKAAPAERARPQNVMPPVASTANNAALLQVIEKHVLTSMLPPKDHPVIQALRAAGYEVEFVLRPI